MRDPAAAAAPSMTEHDAQLDGDVVALAHSLLSDDAAKKGSG